MRMWMSIILGMAVVIATSDAMEHGTKTGASSTGKSRRSTNKIHENRIDKMEKKFKKSCKNANGGMAKQASDHKARGTHGHGHGGQRDGGNATSSGYGSMSDASGGYANGFESLAGEVGEEQSALASETVSRYPDVQEAREFYDSTRGGKSTYSNFGEKARHPDIREAANAYDDLGDIRKDALDQAKAYRARQAEFRDLAEKTGKNAEALDSVPDENGGATMVTKKAAGESESKTSSRATERSEARYSASGSTETLARQGLEGSLPGATLSSGKEASSDIAVKASGATNGDEEQAGGSGAGKSGSSALRDKLLRLREGRLASSREGGGSGAQGEESEAGSEAKDASSTVGAKNLAREMKQEDLAGFSQSLGDPSLSLAGSETDASVKRMLADLTGNDGARGPASMQNDGSIGSSEGPSLFERCRAAHSRCTKSGCVKLNTEEQDG